VLEVSHEAPACPDLGRLVISFFEEYLPEQRGMSIHTIRSYRDTVVLWLQFAARDTRRRLESLGVAILPPSASSDS